MLAAVLLASLALSAQGGSTASAAGPYTVAVEGMNGGLFVNHGSGYNYLGGIIVDAPAVTVLPDGTDLYIATGQNHALYERTDAVGWQLLSSVPIYCLYNPAAAVSGGTLTVTCIGGDNHLYYASTPVPASGLPTMNGWSLLGGTTYNGAAVAPVAGVPTFFIIGGDHQLYGRTASQGWTALGGWCVGRPAAASSGTMTYLSCIGGDTGLYYKTNTGSGWSGFSTVGGNLIEGPAVAATSSGPVFVGEGSSTSVYGTTDGTWFSIGGLVQHGVAAAADGVPSTGGSTPGACPGSQSGCIQAMVNIVNQDRARYGIAPLTLNTTQSNGTGSCPGSYGHSVAMAQSGQIWHTNPNYPQASFPTNICITFNTAGENVGMSSSGNELQDLQTMDNLMMSENPNTPSTCGTTVNHACNILNASYHQIGIGIYVSNNTTWLTEDFTN